MNFWGSSKAGGRKSKVHSDFWPRVILVSSKAYFKITNSEKRDKGFRKPQLKFGHLPTVEVGDRDFCIFC